MRIIVARNFKRNLAKARREPLASLRALWQRLRCGLAYHCLPSGYAFAPETISLFLTRKCNLQCRMCGQWGPAGAFRKYDSQQLKAELGYPMIEKLLADVSPSRPVITLFGGEPLLHSEFGTILKLIKSRGLRCNMVTNGTRLADLAEELVRTGLDEIILSLDGPPEIHDRIRGRGVFSQIEAGIAAINHNRNKYNRLKPVININATVSPENYRHLGALRETAERLRASTLTFHHLLFLSQAVVNDFEQQFTADFMHTPVEWRGFVRSETPAIDPAVLWQTLQETLNRHSQLPCFVYPHFNQEETAAYYRGGEFKPSSYPLRCLSPWMVAYIFPDGSVRPYHTMDYPLGNLNDQPFAAIWNSEPYRAFRRHVRERGCFSVCSRGCTELYRY